MSRTRRARSVGCAICGAPKRPGQGQRLCELHHAESITRGTTRDKPMTPCRKCGSTEGKQKGKQLCDDCAELQRQARNARKRSKKKSLRKRCAGCGGMKPDGPRIRYCSKCRTEREGPRKCQSCGELKVTEKFARFCEDCKQKGIEKRRARQRAYQARLRKEGKKSTPYKGTERERENARLSYRVARMKNGHHVKMQPEKQTSPSEPVVLTAKFRESFRYFERSYKSKSLNGNNEGSAFELLEARTGVAERTIARKVREEETMTVTLADTLLVGMGLSFPIIYDNDDVIPRKDWQEYEAMRRLINRVRGI